ncbi:MAG: reverse transcriptase domain-containing protein [Candidatus Thiodiazotropha endolucinida]|nr:hypothetical protein [Candidatus Thiodiazotropha taylori]MCW4344761.1 reverse transcriptase domain-containing protein [Candidatus Thiodiazotropha endolucinida]
MFLNTLTEGRGTAVYTKKILNAEKIPLATDYSESIWCKIKLDNNDALIIGCIYRSPSATEDNYSSLEHLMRQISERRESHKLIMGDFNLRDINWDTLTTELGEHHMASRFVECIRDTFLFQHILQPTRLRERSTPSVLDLVFTNEEEMINDINYLSSLGKSDHLILTFDFKCYTRLDYSSAQKSMLNFFKADYNAINIQLSGINWDTELNGLDLLRSWSRFAEINIDLMNKHIPVSKPGQDSRNCKPFITRSCIQAIKIKRREWLRYKYKKTDSAFNNYKAARNKVTLQLRQAKYNYEKSLATKIKTDNKIFWKYVRNKTKTKSTVNKLQTENGSLSLSDQETATTLNDYFTTVFEKEPEGPLPDFPFRGYHQLLTTTEITETKIEKILNSLNPSKSPGPDKFHPKYLKETKQNQLTPLKKIFEKSLIEGKLPEAWKQAHVSAIFKKGEKHKPENYRPISLTSVPGKTMEKIIRDALVNHMTEKKLFSTAQHGFIKGKSCTTQLLEFLEDTSQAIDQGDSVDVVYLDFKKAFDKVPHQRLLKKLQGYGISGHIHEWVKDFLSDRKQRVVVNGSQSDWSNVSSGIPQGSVLGPVLFLIYINDLPDVITAFVKLFADDAKVYDVVRRRDPIDTATNKIQSSLNGSVKWAEDWLMFFNPTKCHHLQVGNFEIPTTYTMKSGAETHEIIKVKHEKDLGVTIDSKLTFREHITTKVNLANRNLGIIFRTFTYLDQEIFLNLYKSLVRPHLEYSTPVWSPFYKKDRIIIENVQRRATRLVPSLKGLTYTQRLKQLGLPTLEYRRERADLIQVYKIIHNIDIVEKDKLFKPTQYGATRGHSYKLYKKRSRLNVRANSFGNRIINTWNQLPETVVNAPSVNAFKSRLNKHWSKHPIKFEAACYQSQAGPTTRNGQYSNAPEEAEGLHIRRLLQ